MAIPERNPDYDTYELNSAPTQPVDPPDVAIPLA